MARTVGLIFENNSKAKKTSEAKTKQPKDKGPQKS